MANYWRGYSKIIIFVFVLLVAALTLPRLSPVLFVPLPRPSPAFDCDDAALATYQYFADMGVESRPIIGNLDMTGEAYDESNHVWLLVRFGDKEIAYDWGWPHFDAQHYEGYPITLDNLLYAVSEDSNTLVASAGH